VDGPGWIRVSPDGTFSGTPGPGEAGKIVSWKVRAADVDGSATAVYRMEVLDADTAWIEGFDHYADIRQLRVDKTAVVTAETPHDTGMLTSDELVVNERKSYADLHVELQAKQERFYRGTVNSYAILLDGTRFTGEGDYRFQVNLFGVTPEDAHFHVALHAVRLGEAAKGDGVAIGMIDRGLRGVPAPVTARGGASVRTLAVRDFRSADGKGLKTVDFRHDGTGDVLLVITASKDSPQGFGGGSSFDDLSIRKLEGTGAGQAAFCDRIEYVGVAVSAPDINVWGCSPIRGKDGKVHLFAARFPNPFSHSWQGRSHVARYVADTPAGPFTFREVVYGGEGKEKGEWNHAGICNPCVTRVDGKVVLLFIANSCRTENRRRKGVPSVEHQVIGMMTADSVEGPWSEPLQVLAPSADPTHWTHKAGNGVCNPAFVKFRGKYHLYYKSRDAKYGVAVADALEGPYVHHPEPVTRNDKVIEDGYAFAWKGKIHLLTTDNKGTLEAGGGLLWTSDDGVTFSKPERGFYPLGRYTPRSAHPGNRPVYNNAWKVERPQVLVENGEPAWLYAPCGNSLTGREFTDCLVFRIRPE
jgi:hypothetical protein